MRQLRVRHLAAALGADAGGLVALVGGGGKTTAAYRLLREWRCAGLSAAAATTTKIALPGPDEPELRIGETWEEVRAALMGDEGRGVVLGRRVLASGKVEGIPPEWCDRLLAEGHLAALVVEADGAARLPVKAPAPWEPVVPAGTTLFVAVVGLSCLGAPLGPGHVFRPERVAEATGLALGGRLGTAALARLLGSRQGLSKGRPPAARAVALLNQAEGPRRLAAARQVATRLLGSAGFDRVVAAALRTSRPIRRVWAP